MKSRQQNHSVDSFFAGPGEIRALCRAIDWSTTPLGPVQRWPQSLRLAARMCLDALFPMAVWAGPELVMLYNDGYPPVLGPEKHPWALGRRAREVWPDLWDRLGPELERVMKHGESTVHHDERFLLKRDGAAEEAFFTYSFTPIQEDDGKIVGALNVFLETTERVRASTQRTAILNAISDSSRDAIFAKDLAGRMLFANAAALAIIGKSSEQVLGKTDLEFLDDKEAARQVMANDRGVIEGGILIQFEESVPLPDGTPSVWQSVKTPYRDPDGRVIGLIGISRDITDRKRDEEALRGVVESAELERRRLVAILEALPAGIAIADANGTLIETNATLDRILGRPPSSKNVDEYAAWRGRWADTGEPLAAGDWALARALTSGEVVTSDRVDIERFDGSGWATIINVAAPVRDIEGRIVGGVVAVVDITEQRRAEEAVRASEAQLREAQRLARLGSWEWVVGSEEITWSEGLHLIMGRDLELGAPSFTNLPRFYTQEAWERLRVAIARAIEHGESYELEIEMVRQDGTRCWTITRGEAVRGPAGAVVKLRGTAHDIDERKRAEQERERLVAALREIDQRKNEFLGVLSHELRNPLTPIHNSLYIVQHATPGSEQVARATAIMDRQVSHLARLVDDLLDVTRISRGKIRLQCTRLNLTQVVRQTVEDHRTLLDGIDVSLELPEADLWIVGDPTRLAQIIGNLLSNAAKFTPEGEKVSVSLRRVEKSALLEVADTGLGIDPEMLPRLFEPFAQAERSLARTHGGLGLGLALVKGLVEQHGGTVKAYSEGPGKGSRFTVELLLDERAPQITLGATRTEKAACSHVVLIIEDNVDAAESLRDVLLLDGHEVMVAHSGLDAIAKAHERTPDVVLCDIGLPDMDGYEVARAFRAAPALEKVFIVALTGYAGAEDQRRAAEAGFDRHLAKPPNLKALRAMLAGSKAKRGCA